MFGKKRLKKEDAIDIVKSLIPHVRKNNTEKDLEVIASVLNLELERMGYLRRNFSRLLQGKVLFVNIDTALEPPIDVNIDINPEIPSECLIFIYQCLRDKQEAFDESGNKKTLIKNHPRSKLIMKYSPYKPIIKPNT